MLKKYKNALLQIIKDSQFDPEDFSSDDGETIFTIRYLDTPFRFSFIHPTSHHTFMLEYISFSPNFQKTTIKLDMGFPDATGFFRNWLKEHIGLYLQEQTTPDLWKQLEDQKALLDYTHQDNDKATHFTEEQKKLIRLGLDEILLLIKKEFQPTADEIGVIKNRLDYMSEALDRLNKFDWKAVLVSTIISISIALSLDTAQGNALFHMFKQVLSKTFTLLLK